MARFAVLVLGAKRAMGGLPWGQLSGAACVSTQPSRLGRSSVQHKKVHRAKRWEGREARCGGWAVSCGRMDARFLWWVGCGGCALWGGVADRCVDRDTINLQCRQRQEHTRMV